MGKPFLAQTAANQDTLLQFYRQNFFIFASSSSFTATLFGLSSVFINNPVLKLVLAAATVIVATVATVFNSKILDTIRKRREAVDFWHKEILNYEKRQFPHQKVFTKFKLHQKNNMKPNRNLKMGTRTITAEQLLVKNNQHVRKILDEKFFNTTKYYNIVLSITVTAIFISTFFTV